MFLERLCPVHETGYHGPVVQTVKEVSALDNLIEELDGLRLNMFAASTPLLSRKRLRTEDCPSPGISPIRKGGMEVVKSGRLPKLPNGTTLEVRRGPPYKGPLAENLIMGNLPASTIEAQTRKSLAYLDGIIALPAPSAPKKRLLKESTSSVPAKQRRKTIDVKAHRPSQAPDGLHSILKSVDPNTKKNLSHFPELVVISDSDEEPENLHQRTRRSVARRSRKTIAVASNGVGDVLNMRDFTKMGSNPIAGLRTIIMHSSRASVKISPNVAEDGGASCVAEDHTTIIKSEPQDFRMPDVKRTYNVRSRAGAVAKSEKLSSIPENGSQPEHRDVRNTDAYEFNTESQQESQPEIAKFAMADVNSWKEMKDQQGIYFSKAPSPHASGADGDAFPARAGYLKMEAKKILDIQSCANNVVFTVVKGKGRMKNKTEMKSSIAKPEMIVGDILTVPQGSTFNFTNLGTKNDLIMSYVKLT